MIEAELTEYLEPYNVPKILINGLSYHLLNKLAKKYIKFQNKSKSNVVSNYISASYNTNCFGRRGREKIFTT